MDAHINFRLNTASLSDFMKEIQDELRLFNDLVEGKPDTPFGKRMMVRVIFSVIDANVSHMKGSALAFAQHPEKVFQKKTLLALRDLRERKKNNGELELVSARLTVKENIKLAFDAFAQANGATSAVKFNSPEWNDFLKAVSIRDRVTHPKSGADWKLSDADVQLAKNAWLWFGKKMVEVSNRAKIASNKL